MSLDKAFCLIKTKIKLRRNNIETYIILAELKYENFVNENVCFVA